MSGIQDLLALVIVVTAGLWLGRHLWRRLAAPPCQPPTQGPAGSDGFVPLETLRRPNKRD
ncbi:MAG: hypothetical protein EBU59_09625 [Planctomycetia bacterium]|jgi:hypothetical protein|nr:hypothetical protein [Planctomycetia bacterium]